MNAATSPASEGFTHTIDGTPVGLYTIRAPDSVSRCSITNYGARLVSLLVPDRTAQLRDVALGYPTLQDYLRQPEDYMGAIVGRCANRIPGGTFSLAGQVYMLSRNDKGNTLHGGDKGLHARVWTVVQVAGDELVLSYRSAAGEEGFPGTLDIEVSYRWTDSNTLRISYKAFTDAATPVNLSNHAYFNLSGEGSTTILDHQLQVDSDAVTPVDAALIPTGMIMPVAGSPFDFRQPRGIGDLIESEDQQLFFGKGYDHNFALRGLQPAVTLHSPVSGITLSLTTDRPGLQVYSGNFLDGSRRGKSGDRYGYRSAIVLEPQGFPDAVHNPAFPSVILEPGDTYKALSLYSFTS